jgi:hypothetical protein
MKFGPEDGTLVLKRVIIDSKLQLLGSSVVLTGTQHVLLLLTENIKGARDSAVG